MKIKNILLSTTTAIALFTGITTNTNVIAKEINDATDKCTLEQTSKLNDHQTELFYMYSNNEGYFFLDPKAETESVIFVGINDYKVDKNFKVNTTTIHHGKKFIGTFADDSLWELVKIEEAK